MTVSPSRKLLQERKKAEEEEERWKERRRRREKKLQRVVLRRAQAHDPHLALAQAHPAKLKEFRYQRGGGGHEPSCRTKMRRSPFCISSAGIKSFSVRRSTSWRSKR